MSQTELYGANNIMHCAPQLKAAQPSFNCPVPTVNSRSSCSLSGTSSDSDSESDRSSRKMHSQFQYPHPHMSGTSTPMSTSSSTSYVSNASSSSSTAGRPRRSSLKPNLRPSRSVGENLNKSSPPIVRFADPEPMPKLHTWPAPRPPIRQQPEPLINRIPDPATKSRQHYNPSFSLSTTDLTKYSRRPLAYAPRPVPHVAPQIQQPGFHNTMKTRVSTGASGPVPAPPPVQEPKRAGGPLPAHLPPPVLSVESRKSSHQSSDSNSSVQSAPAILLTPPSTTLPPAQYNPLQNYVPCLYPTCYSHYTPVHENPTHYMEPDPYNLTRHHGYCARHAMRELREATAICKKELERLRQSAGRKTLGLIAVEFEIYLEHFRSMRKDVDVQLQQQQKLRVLGPSSIPPTTPQKSKTAPQQQDTTPNPATTWDWRYTPRLCTRTDCPSLPYSPYANHLYVFYTTRRNSSFVPLQTLCPPCAKAEVELFEAHIREIRASRPVWDKKEWTDWFVDAARDRDMELEFWARVQESGVRGRGPAVSAEGLSDRRGMGRGNGKGGGVGSEGGGKKAARKSVLIFRKIFGGKTA